MTRTRSLSAVSAALAGFALVGCASDGPSHVPPSYFQGSTLDRYDLSARPKTEMIEVSVLPGDSQLRREEIYKIEAFLADYRSVGHGPLMLSIPGDHANEQLLISAAADIRDMGWRAGVEYDQIDGSAYDAGGRGNAPIILAFKRYTAVKPDCPSWAAVDAMDAVSNNDTPVLGCAVRTNMAAIIADPGDLMGVRALDAGDPERIGEQLAKWRRGETTNAARGEAESGAVSAAVE